MLLAVMQQMAFILFNLALVITGALGTETRLLFFWPGVIAIGFAGLMAALKWRLKILFPPADKCLLMTLVCAIFMVGRAAFSPVVYQAREDVIILLAAWVVYGLTITLVSHPRSRLVLMVSLLVLVMVNLAVGSIHLSGDWGFHIVPDFMRAAEGGRIGGLFVNANHLAAFLSMVLFLAAGWLCFGRGGAALKLWLAFMVVAMTLGMSLTISRGALFGLAVGACVFTVLGLWVVWQTQRQYFWSLIGGIAAALVLGGALLWKVNEEYLRTRISNHSVASDIRTEIWKSALTQFSLSPNLGAGARMYYQGGTQYRSPGLATWTPEAFFAHNEYLQMLADYGWVGLALLLLVIILHLSNGLKFIHWFVFEKFMRTGRVLSMNLAICLGSISALAATLAHAFVEFHFHVPATAMMGAVLLGLLANPGFEQMQKPLRRIPGVRVMTKVLLGVSALILLASSWQYGRADYAFAKAAVAARHKDAEGQRQLLDQVTKLDPHNGDAFYQRALHTLDKLSADDRASQKEALQLAATDLETAMALNPYKYLYPLAYADVCDAQMKPEKARELITKAIQLAPLHEEPRLALAVHHHRVGHFAEAESCYLWARMSNAMNPPGVANWQTSYALLLRHVAQMRGSAPVKP